MDANVIVGTVVLAGALVTLVGLVFWSRQRIERIARMEHRSARRILKDLDSV